MMDRLNYRFSANWLARRAGLFLLCATLCPALLASCQESAAPAQPQPQPTPASSSPAALLLAGELLAAGQPPSSDVSAVGYLIVDANDATLLGGVAFEADGTPRSLAQAAEPIWLGADAAQAFIGNLRSAGAVRYALVQARGKLQGPGSFGPGSYRYQIAPAALTPIAVQETTVADLIEQPGNYAERVVRVLGGLLVLDDGSALLVDQLGAGGIPKAKARQIKMVGQLGDDALLRRFKSAPGGLVHFGQVQIEGVLRKGALAPLSITLFT